MQTTKHQENRGKGTELLTLMGEVIAKKLGNEGVHQHRASEIALNVIEKIAAEFGGLAVYFPKGFFEKSEDRGEAIYKRFMAGASVDELAGEFNISSRQIYNVIAAVRAKRKAAR